jgi:hypothetical protein
MSSGRSTTDHRDPRAATALRERRSPSVSPSPSPPAEDGNPFAPPPDGTPEQPWQPREPEGDSGSGPQDGRWSPGPEGRWSDRQPAGQPGGLGRRPDQGPGAPAPGGPRFDPTDPAQRRARYALLSGMWGLFCSVLLGWTSVALLLGALALYWGISSLRMTPEQRAKARAAAAAALTAGGQTPPPAANRTPEDDKPQRTAAVSGIVTGSIALALVAATFTAQFVYHDYYACTRDALTAASRQGCADLLPAPLRSVLDQQG